MRSLVQVHWAIHGLINKLPTLSENPVESAIPTVLNAQEVTSHADMGSTVTIRIEQPLDYYGCPLSPQEKMAALPNPSACG